MDSRQQPDFEALIARVASALQEQNLPFMLIGGQAVLLHGRPRLTEDIDITLGVDPGGLPLALKACRKADLDILPDQVEEFVRATYVLPAIDSATSIRIDLIFSSLPYERQAIERAVDVELSRIPVPFASAEDLILHKLFAGRPRDIEDASGVVVIQGDTLDWDYMEGWVEEFSSVPGRETMPEILEKIRSELR
jgi:hypothetical protein